MKSFREYVSEAKQVGEIHHFTTVNSLADMVKQKQPMTLYSRNNENISFTRNPLLPIFNSHFNDCNVRITVDGDSLSNKYKIKPVAGLPNGEKGVLDTAKSYRVPRSSGEAEEAVINHPVNILSHIKHITILQHPKHDNDYNHIIKPELDKLGISHNYARSLRTVSESNNLTWDVIWEIDHD